MRTPRASAYVTEECLLELLGIGGMEINIIGVEYFAITNTFQFFLRGSDVKNLEGYVETPEGVESYQVKLVIEENNA